MGTVKKVKKAQGGDTLNIRELKALAHQKRGRGTLTNTFVKKSDPIMNEIGYLTDYQMKQLKDYMDKSGTKSKIYQGLPNFGRMFGSSAADIPKGSKLEKQKTGGKTKMKTGGTVKKTMSKSSAKKQKC